MAEQFLISCSNCLDKTHYFNITNCLFLHNDNSLHDSGGAIDCEGSVGVIQNCTFIGNQGFVLGGSILNSCNMEISNSTFVDSKPNELLSTGNVIYSSNTLILKNVVSRFTRPVILQLYTNTISSTIRFTSTMTIV